MTKTGGKFANKSTVNIILIKLIMKPAVFISLWVENGRNQLMQPQANIHVGASLLFYIHIQ